MPVHKEAMSDKKQPPPACTVAVILKRMQRGEVREDMHMYIYIYMCVRNWEGYIGEERSAARELWLDLGMSHAF